MSIEDSIKKVVNDAVQEAALAVVGSTVRHREDLKNIIKEAIREVLQENAGDMPEGLPTPKTTEKEKPKPEPKIEATEEPIAKERVEFNQAPTEPKPEPEEHKAADKGQLTFAFVSREFFATLDEVAEVMGGERSQKTAVKLLKKYTGGKPISKETLPVSSWVPLLQDLAGIRDTLTKRKESGSGG